MASLKEAEGDGTWFTEGLFWWYLATVELTDRIVASQVNGS